MAHVEATASAGYLQREARLLAIDGAVLIGGILSIVVSYPPVILALAAVHLLIQFVIAPAKLPFLLMSTAAVGVSAAVLWLMWLWIPSPFLALLGAGPNWSILIPVAILGGGVISTIFMTAGLADLAAERGPSNASVDPQANP